MVVAVSDKRLSKTTIEEIVEAMKRSAQDQTTDHEMNEEKGRGSFRHDDGWGCAWLNSFGHIRGYRSVKPLHEEDPDDLGRVMELAADSPFFMLHVRKASPNIPKGSEYVHPFVRSTRMGIVSFCHNGTIQNVETLGLIEYAEEVMTKSDSERFLYYLMGRLERDRDDDLRALKTALNEIPAGSTANYILALENPFQAYVSTNFSRTPKYLTMQYAIGEDLIVAASEVLPNISRLEADMWKPLENHEILKMWKENGTLRWVKA